MNVYLDIDGVLLANETNAANYAHEFLELVVTRFPTSTFWLTTHCHGDAKTAVDRLSLVFEQRIIDLVQNIQPTDWNEAKTEAIDFSKPFLWFDDDLFDDERADLEKHNVLDNWIEVDLSRDHNQLARFIASFPLATDPTA